MSEPNPYESPKVDQPLKPVQIAKRSVGLAAILLLTPPAMVVAVAVCCTSPKFLPGGIAFLVILGGPFGVLLGLMGLAAFLDRTSNAAVGRTSKRGEFLMMIPLIFAAASLVGFILALIGLTVSESIITGLEAAIYLGAAIFWIVTGGTLVASLIIAWRKE
jgi:hypothetical protein